jgi:hypothetical protein
MEGPFCQLLFSAASVDGCLGWISASGVEGSTTNFSFSVNCFLVYGVYKWDMRPKPRSKHLFTTARLPAPAVARKNKLGGRRYPVPIPASGEVAEQVTVNLILDKLRSTRLDTFRQKVIVTVPAQRQDLIMLVASNAFGADEQVLDRSVRPASIRITWVDTHIKAKDYLKGEPVYK